MNAAHARAAERPPCGFGVDPSGAHTASTTAVTTDPGRAPDGVAAHARAAAAGDARALTRLAPALYRIAARCLAARLRDLDRDERDDLASEGVAKVLARLHTVRPTSDAMFVRWVRVVVWHAAVDACRRRGRRDAGWHVRGGAALAAGVLAGASPARQTAAALGDADPDDERAWSDAHDGAWVAAWDPETLDDVAGPLCGAGSPLAVLARLAVDAQAQLPADTPLVLWAHLVTGAGWAEVAALLDTTPAGAKRRFQRGLASLRAAVWRQAAALPDDVRPAALARLHALDPLGPAGGPAWDRAPSAAAEDIA